ncbi:MAG TPA: FosX/FosE/FosI family fosfomycin resistance thiol transferase [Syntrophobacteraceae bacterium]|nr:FosX/FosE/FosI family fosfomycin resistance thiol transferase [Syntrophobacteraceae bacterium]HBD06760.1 FosX/FosE/FosI family fosfomycin resistance thiol transferase [Syntrophobacteraceae bacterium]
MIEMISHITFIVRDVEKMGNFLKTIFNAEEVYDSTGKNYSLSYEKFFIIGGTWVAVMEGEPLLERSYNHVAFKISDSEFDRCVTRIKELGVEVNPGRDRVTGEARSIYFYDYDNHLFELHTGTLGDRLLHYSKG